MMEYKQKEKTMTVCYKNKEDYADEVVHLYTTDDSLTKKEIAIKLQIPSSWITEITNSKLPPTEFPTREQYWENFHLDDNETLFLRRIGLSGPKSAPAESLLLQFLTLDDYRNFVSEGKSSSEILAIVNMPTLNKGKINKFRKKYGILHTADTISVIAKKQMNEIWSDPDKKAQALRRRHDTNMGRFGYHAATQSPAIKKKVRATTSKHWGKGSYAESLEGRKKSAKNFMPTKYVPDLDTYVRVTDTEESLEKFLRLNFPDKDLYSLGFIAEVVGMPYLTIVNRFGTRTAFVSNGNMGRLHEKMPDFLIELGFEENTDFIVNDRQGLKPQEIDFYFPKKKVGIEVNDLDTHNSTYDKFGTGLKPKNYHMEKSKKAKEQGIRLIHAWEHYFNNPQQYEVLKNAIKHALGISKYRVYARNTYVKQVDNTSLREFFDTNNIQGFRGAKTAYALFDKKTDEVLMAYSVGASHFAHNKYDMELIRGASKLDTTIVGGASKLWKFIIESNPEVNSIVYYIDRNIYNGSSISTLEGNLELISTQVGFWNYFRSTKEMKNRQPGKHKEIKELVAQGKVWEVYNAGTETYVWTRE